ncbi:MAG: MBG domain-containing protein, partial [Verrucomicrobiota bacterium]
FTNSLLNVTAKTATVIANAKSKTYGDVNPVLDAVVTGTVNGDTLAYTLATTATATSGIGSYPISVTLGSNPNYTVTPTDSSLTVATKSASVVANVKTKTYGAANPVLDAVVTGTVNGDILAYSLATTATVTSGVGSYPITVTLGSNPNYSLLFTNSLLNVTAKTATVIANSKSKTYGDVNPALDAVVTGTVNGDTLAYSLATTATGTSGIGSYPIAVTLGSNPNYSVTPTDSSLTVGAKPASVVANSKSKTYGSANPVLDAVVTGTVNGDILAYSLATTATVTSGVGSYPITVTLGSNPNYSLLFTNSLLSVTAKSATVVANSKSKTYGDANPALDAVVTGTVNGDSLTYSLATTATVTSGTGSYPIAVTLGSNPNYSVTPTDSSLTVSAKVASVLANAKTKTYGAANPAFDAVVTGTVNGDILAYSLATTATVTSGVGAYPITVILGSNPNYSLVSSNSLLTVTVKSASVVANAKSKTYGGVNPLLDAAVTGTVNGDVLSYTLATTSTTTSGVGSYPITVTLGSNPNYTVTPTDSTLTVSSKAASLVANAKFKTYGAANPLLDAVVTGTVNGDILAYSLATTATVASGVGSYPITITLGSNPNYSVTPTDSSLAVSAKSATVIANSKSKTYGEVNPLLDAVVSGTVNGDILSYSLATTATATSGVGSYPISVTLGSNPNYSVTPTDSSLTVGSKSATVVANSKSKTYGDVNPVLD